MFSIGTLIMLFHSNYFIVKLGLRYALTLGLGLFCIGNIINLFIADQFYVVTLGQLIAGLGFPIIINSQANFCDNWFNAKTRPIILAVTSVMGPIGSIFGYIAPL